MTPRFSSLDEFYGAKRDTVISTYSGKDITPSNALSYLWYVAFLQLCPTNLGAFCNKLRVRLGTIIPPALSGHVLKVFLVGSKKQMVRIATKSIIALVAHAHSLRRLAIRDYPHAFVCGHFLKPGCFVIKLAISVTEFSTSPRPAFSKLRLRVRRWAIPVNLGPESFLVTLCHKLKTAVQRKCCRRTGSRNRQTTVKWIDSLCFWGHNKAVRFMPSSVNQVNPI